MPEPGIQRLIAAGSTSAMSGTTYPSTSADALPVRQISNHPAVITVRASTDYNASTTSTATADQTAYGQVIGMYLFLDQSAVAASSAGGGTGILTHTVQLKDPIGATYTGSTAVLTGTTGVGTWIVNCYPGNPTLAATSGAPGKADMPIGGIWRINTTSSSSATNFTYSISAVYLPTAASSS